MTNEKLPTWMNSQNPPYGYGTPKPFNKAPAGCHPLHWKGNYFEKKEEKIPILHKPAWEN